jgi:transcriptional regulator with XRE-family HTH domain
MKELREATGLTQQLLADLVKVSREAIGMGESGLRGLPASALQKLVTLWALVPPTTEVNDLPLITDVLSNEVTMADEQLARYKEGCKMKAAKKQRALNKMTFKYEQGLRLLQVLKAYSATLTPNEENADILNWIDGATSFAQLRLMENSFAKQRLLALEIRQLLTV